MANFDPVSLDPRSASQRTGPSVPPMPLLAEFAPPVAWKAARLAATVDDLRMHLGAAIVGDHGLVVGTSTIDSPIARREGLASLHAERAALVAGAHVDLTGSTCVIMGLNRRGDGSPWSCCPCLACAEALYARGVSRVCYPQRTGDGMWTVRCETPAELIGRADERHRMAGLRFARQLRLAVA